MNIFEKHCKENCECLVKEFTKGEKVMIAKLLRKKKKDKFCPLCKADQPR